MALSVLGIALISCGGGHGERAAPTPAPVPTTTEPSPTPSETSTPTPPHTTKPPTATPTATPTSTAPTQPASAVVVRRLPTGRRVAALTFDAGSDVGSTASILTFLEANRLQATFVLTGKWITANPVLARRIVADGFVLINHTYDHASFTGVSTSTTGLTSAQRVTELRRAEQSLLSATGARFSRMFRPPYGDRDPATEHDILAAGYWYDVLWTVDTLGWRGIAPASVVQRCVDALVPGEIILMHVGADSTDAQALAGVVSAVRQRGYSFVSVADYLTGARR